MPPRRAAGARPVPLLWRILIGNALVIVVGAVGGTLITRHLAGEAADAWLVAFFATAGIALSVAVNAWIVHAALRPLYRLRTAVDGLGRGPGGLSAEALAAGDPDLRRLAASIDALYRELEERNRRLHALSERFIGAQEGERLRIARSLHDDTGQALASLAVGLDRLGRRLPPEAADLTAEVADARALAAASLEELRAIIHGLRPTLLDDLGLVPAIRWHARSTLEPAGVRVEVQADDELQVPGDAAINLYRIAQEAVHNVLRHAGARTATIRLESRDGHVRLEVRDDGRGFDPERTARDAVASGRLGLLGIAERAELLGGTALVDAAPGRGTRVVVSLPLEGQVPRP